MKGLNVKKIAALAIGALFVGSAAVSASRLMYEDTTLVNDNGVPQVSVLIPAAAQAAMTDGVAGARIASKLAAESYKEVPLTATLSGEAICGAGEVGGEGECPVLMDETSVTLTIHSPGITGVYTTTPYIYDVFDKDINDRDGTGDAYNADDADDEASPLYEDAAGVDLLALRIDDEFAPFKDHDFKIGSMSFTQKQFAYIEGRTNIVSDDAPFGELDIMYYSLKFFGSEDQGIPVCTTHTNDDWSLCDGSRLTERRRPQIKLLNDYWYIVGMEAPTTAIDNSEERVPGGSVTLAKEAHYGIVTIGESLETEDYYVQLEDISRQTGQVGGDLEYPAILTLIDKATGAVIEQTQIAPGDGSVTVGPNDEVMVRVYQTAPGITLASKWAEMAIYSEEWELRDGQRINDDNRDWTATLYWKNKDGDVNDPATTGVEDAPDNLREIVFENTKGWDLEEGDSISFVDEPTAFEFMYSGLTTEAMKTMSFKLGSDRSMKDCADTSVRATGMEKDNLLIIDGNGETFKPGLGATERGPKIYVVLEDFDADPLDPTSFEIFAGDVYVQRTSGSDAGCFDLDANIFGAGIVYEWNYLGTNNGALIIENPFANTFQITIAEEIGQVAGDSDAFATIQFDLDQAGALDWDIVDLAGIAGTDEAEFTYTALIDSVYGASLSDVGPTTIKSRNFVTLRGTEINRLTDSEYSFNFPRNPRKMQFTFTTEGEEAIPNTATWLAHQGDEETFGDTTITVDKISCAVGACTVSGAGAAGCDYIGGLEAVIAGEGTATVNSMLPGTVNPKSLIMLDTEGAALAGNFVSVGGPVVNTVTARELTGANAHDFNAQPVFVKQIATGKIIVAGRDAADTLTAADQFIAAMQRV